MRMLKKFILLAGAWSMMSTAAIADPIALKCIMTIDGKRTEIWLGVDPVSNTMTVGGNRQQLTMTNKYYTSVANIESPPGFAMIHRIDRENGELEITGVLGSTVRYEWRGICDKAPLPFTKH
jgi:hypothetical protein